MGRRYQPEASVAEYWTSGRERRTYPDSEGGIQEQLPIVIFRPRRLDNGSKSAPAEDTGERCDEPEITATRSIQRIPEMYETRDTARQYLRPVVGWWPGVLRRIWSLSSRCDAGLSVTLSWAV